MSTPTGSLVWRAPILDNRPAPDTLYHYTTSGGLQGILESQSLHATDMAYLNDSTELKYGADAVQQILSGLLAERSDDFRSRPRKTLYNGGSLDDVMRVLPTVFPRARDRFVFGIVCLTEEPDLLSQWRGYGMPGGYSLGFDVATLKSLLVVQALTLTAVKYGALSAHAAVRKYFDDWLDSLEMLESEPDINPDEAVADLHNAIMGFGSQIKHPAFKEENEWRLGDLETTTSPAVLFRQGGLGLTPYVKLNIAKSVSSPLIPIKSVRVGPGADMELRAHAVVALLERLGYPDGEVEVTTSNIPFRQS